MGALGPCLSWVLLLGLGLIQTVLAAKDYNREPVFKSRAECRFLHIINDYKPSGLTATEFDIVFESMRTAQRVAKQEGIQVDFRFVLQKGDQLSVEREHLLDVKDISEAFKDPTTGRYLPTPGGILDAGMEGTDHPAIVFTNRDIGLYPQFYVESCDMLRVPGQLVVETTRVLLKLEKALTDYEATLRGRGFVHRGADCWVMAREVMPACFREDRRLVVGYPPWGALLRHILHDHAMALRCGQEGGYRIYRSSPQNPDYRRTFHLERNGASAQWLNWLQEDRFLYRYLQVLPGRVMERPPKLSFIVDPKGKYNCTEDDGPMVWPLCDSCKRPCEGFWASCPTPDCQMEGPKCHFPEAPAIAECQSFNNTMLVGKRTPMRALHPITFADYETKGITA
ncbi:uncharacterized protein MONBRDRAFT_37047 [Monosiga brevicollis MX1]|uniref:Uncharacterized protein n=1 Tax=Monosiga brevicollis TaxID=81824 RepID=A9UZ92_MONBE|nr:uncharacterized protein MONBRDRAFT_37047 [Monosiga brevicollis MX1]EDQ89326.1 predicted protein [Monosiga brevicollis MX1]|eukprot:XP_001745902.1 hypothetical protein [Monosiga brevicollis MX1]